MLYSRIQANADIYPIIMPTDKQGQHSIRWIWYVKVIVNIVE